MIRLSTVTPRSGPSAQLRVYAVVMAIVFVAGCVRSPGSVRPTRRISYWEALADLYPAEAVAAAQTDSEKRFAEALASLMAGDLEKAEQGFAQLRLTATDSVIRAGSNLRSSASPLRATCSCWRAEASVSGISWRL